MLDFDFPFGSAANARGAGGGASERHNRKGHQQGVGPLLQGPGRLCCRLGVHPAPCTLYPAPCTLHPTPYTLHPTPYTLHPTPYTRHPSPCTLHPAFHTLHPIPYTPHPSFLFCISLDTGPTPSTLNAQQVAPHDLPNQLFTESIAIEQDQLLWFLRNN